MGRHGKRVIVNSVMISEDSDRTMNTFLGMNWNFTQELSPLAIQSSEYVYVEGYLV